MEIRFIDNQNEKLGDLLVNELNNAVEARIAVAFVSGSGLRVLGRGIEHALGKGASVEVLVGLDFSTTDPAALWHMNQWRKDCETFNFFCFPPGAAGIYHPKMYLLLGGESATIVVGSSNLTDAGLMKNAEANLFIQEAADSELFSDAVESYLRLKFDKRFIPDEDFLASYEEATRKNRKAVKTATKAADIAALEKTLRTKAASLAKPKATANELVGWMKMVYEALPHGEFTNADAYQHEPEFREKYPENKHVIEKIRQQLQNLEKLGLLEHISPGTWRKL